MLNSCNLQLGEHIHNQQQVHHVVPGLPGKPQYNGHGLPGNYYCILAVQINQVVPPTTYRLVTSWFNLIFMNLKLIKI